jgi:hypothetical protein
VKGTGTGKSGKIANRKTRAERPTTKIESTRRLASLVNRDSILLNAAFATRGHAKEKAIASTVNAVSNPINEKPVAGAWEVESIEELWTNYRGNGQEFFRGESGRVGTKASGKAVQTKAENEMRKLVTFFRISSQRLCELD